MAKQVLLNVRAFVGTADLTGQSNKIELIDAMELKKTTNYASGGAEEVLAGVESLAISGEGQYDAGTVALVDDEMWAARRAAEAWSIGPETAAVGALAYVTSATRMDAKLFGAIGEVAPWMLTAAGTWPLARGMFIQSAGAAITTTANGTGVQVGAVGATQRLYGCLHVLSIAGTGPPTLAVTIQSGSSNAFSSPTTRLTFTTATGLTSEAKRTAVGAITDTWYRAVLTVDTGGGTGTSFLAAIALGIA